MSQSACYSFEPAEPETPSTDMTAALAKPKRPLSAYNFFFKTERAKILTEIPDVAKERKPRRSHGKIGFKDLATRISYSWKSLSIEERAIFYEMAASDKKRYVIAKKEWHDSANKGCSGAAVRQATRGHLDELLGYQPNIEVESVDRNQITFPLLSNLQRGIHPEPDQQNNPVGKQELPVCLCYSSTHQQIFSCQLPFEESLSYSLQATPLESWSQRDLDRKLVLDLDDECKEYLRNMFK
jgi:HMG-box domain